MNTGVTTRAHGNSGRDPATTGPTTGTDYQPHVDGLRAVAVLAVIAFHAFPHAVPGGFIGVDVFFVISGFLISSILYRDFNADSASGLGVIGRFYLRRVRRIFPSLIVVILAVFTLGYLTLMPGEFKTLGTRIVASSAFYANLLFSKDTGYFQLGALSNPLLHLWSLGVEEQFYLAWPLALWLVSRCRISYLSAALFLATFSFFWSVHVPDLDQPAAFFLPHTRFWELLAGSVVAIIAPLVPDLNLGITPGRRWALLCCLILVGLLAFFPDSPWRFYATWPAIILVVGRFIRPLLPVAIFAAVYCQIWSQLPTTANWVDLASQPASPFWALAAVLLAAAVAWCVLGPKPAALPVTPREGLQVPDGQGLKSLLGIVGLALIAWGLFQFTEQTYFPGAWAFVPVMGTCLILGAGQSAWPNRWLLARQPLVWIGLISYPLYLWHWPILSFSRIALASPHRMLITLLGIAATFILAWGTYRFVESPLRHGGRAKVKMTALVAAMAIIAALAAGIVRTNGLPGRLPPLLRELDEFKYPRAELWRSGDYFLLHHQEAKEFKQDPNEIQAGKPTIVLWGDSCAAALYAGFKASYGSTYNIVQRTASAMPPILGQVFKQHRDSVGINNTVFETIKEIRPDLVVLDAHWSTYDWRGIEKTIVALQAAGINRIVVIGPVPVWQISLPQQIINHYRSTQAIPTRLSTGMEREPLDIDPLLADLCQRLGVRYFSPYQILRSPEGVLVRLGETADSLVQADDVHLTAAGAQYVVARFPDLHTP